MATEAQRRAVAKYDKENTVFVGLKFNKTTDADIIDRLARSDNKQAFIKECIRAKMDTEMDTEAGRPHE